MGRALNGYLEDTATSFRDRFNAAVADFDARVAALNQTETELWEVHPDVQASGDEWLQGDWQDAMDRVIAMNSSIDSVRAQVQSIASWWSGVRSSLGIAPGEGGALAGLALIPAIPWSAIALIVGGTTAIAGVIYAASQVINRARQYRFSQASIEQQQAGGPPLVNPYAEQDAGGGLFDGLPDAAMWLVGGLVVLAVLPKIAGPRT